jgi:hypothetical protein
MDHILNLVREFQQVADRYTEKHPDSDVNDILSAFAFILISNCKDYGVSRMEILRNIGLTYDERWWDCWLVGRELDS